MSCTVVILAGDRYAEASLAGHTNKALLPVGRRPCLMHVLSAVERSAAARSVVVVGPAILDEAIAGANLTKPIKRVNQGESLIDNIEAAFAGAAEATGERIILMAADVPLIRAAELDRFAELARGCAADAVISIAAMGPTVLRTELASVYRKSMIVAAGGPYLFGNLFAARREVLVAAKVIERARKLRKQSNVVNMLRTLPTLVGLGVRTAPGLVVWLRLVVARSIWRRRGGDSGIPRIAPSLTTIGRAIAALVARRVSVEFVDIGTEGACFDIDDERQYEAVRGMVADKHSD